MTAEPRTPQPLTDEELAEIDGRSAHLYEYVELPNQADIVVGQDVPALLVEVDRLKTVISDGLARIVRARQTESSVPALASLDAIEAVLSGGEATS